jgi:hypothetical protein
MNNRATLAIIVAVGGFALVGASASGQTVSFGYTEGDGNWNIGSGTATVVANNFTGINTYGSVDLVGSGIAFFNPGMSGLEDLFISISRVGNSGSGIWSVSDSSGDDFQGNLSGTFSDVGGFMVFNATATGAFDLPGSPFNGSGDTPGFTQPAGNFAGVIQILWAASDSSSFSDAVTSVQGTLIVPAPSAMALLGVAGLVAGRRRRS